MKPMLLAALLAAIASSALTALVVAPAAPPGPPTPGVTAADLKAALGDVERELAVIRMGLLRREPAPRPARPSGSPVPEGTQPETRGLSSGATPSGEPEPEGLRESGAALTPAPDYERLRVLDGWSRNPELRRSWMFRSESEVLDAFGTPDQISTSGGEETWIYEFPTVEVDAAGNSVKRNMALKLNRGRLVWVYD